MSTSAWLVLIVFSVLLAAAWFTKRTGDAPTSEHKVDEDESEREATDVGVIEIGDAIDLHGFRPKEIPQVVESYLEAAVDKGLVEVRIIHGRGKGVQRRAVQALLKRHRMVEAFGDAPAFRGGWGATVARLRKKQ